MIHDDITNYRSGGCRSKNPGVEGVQRGYGEGLSVGLEVVLANHSMTYEENAGPGPGCVRQGRRDLKAQPESVRFGDIRIESLLFADYDVLLSSPTVTCSIHWDSLQPSVKQLE